MFFFQSILLFVARNSERFICGKDTKTLVLTLFAAGYFYYVKWRGGGENRPPLDQPKNGVK